MNLLLAGSFHKYMLPIEAPVKRLFDRLQTEQSC